MAHVSRVLLRPRFLRVVVVRLADANGHLHATTPSAMVSLETATWLSGRACGSNHEVAFVHIPKTGGTTISTALARCVNATQMADRFHSTTHHFRASKYIEMLRSRNASWPDVFSFTMVRDPYARAVSTFYYPGESPAVFTRYDTTQCVRVVLLARALAASVCIGCG